MPPARKHRYGFFFKPAVWAVLWLMFAVRPALADELTNLLSSREQILRQFAEDEQPVLPVNRAPARRAGNADELIGNAMGLNEQPVLPVNRAPARRAGNADELIGSAMGLLGIAYRYGGTSVSTGFDCSGFMQHIFKRAMGINLPRTSAEQARMGTPVARSELQPGIWCFSARSAAAAFPMSDFISATTASSTRRARGKISKSPA
ncbi:Outer membrane protein precursor GNA2001 [Neisseria gonorrhoeae]|uniref:Outer membrane protein GNA2001 n=1 Tax=Neisseria gonorrhoeae TaxID=485 RepID=A0A378VWP8_NEIGO|nr:Outer membrane protein precursor GNA2001 [Neisseria gonorrhoeae]